ncbi:hypothetical protein D9M70_439780 [compost metagenome]
MGHADGVGVGDHDRPEEEAAVLDPVGAGHLAVAVEAMHPSVDRDGGGRSGMRQDGGDAGADRTLAARARRLFRDRAEADGYAFDVGDGVEAAGAAGKGQPDIAGASGGRGGSFIVHDHFCRERR